MAYAVQATTNYQTYPERPPGADLPPKKVCNLDPMAPSLIPALPGALYSSIPQRFGHAIDAIEATLSRRICERSESQYDIS